MSSPQPFNVNILDRDYRMVCSPEEQALLLECAALVDSRMRQVRQSGKLVGVDRIAVMAALTLARELIQTGPAGAQAGPSSAELQRRLDQMREQLDASIAPQEKLFD